MTDTRQFILRVEPAKSVHLNGAPVAKNRLSYDAQTPTPFIELPELATSQSLDLTVSFSNSLKNMQKQLDGKPGQFRRLQWLGEKVKSLSARENWAATIPKALLNLIEIPARIQYYPESLQKKLKVFDRDINHLETIIASMPQIDNSEAQALTKHLVFEAQ